MTVAAEPVTRALAQAAPTTRARSESVWAHAMRSGRVVVGGGVLLVILLLCLVTLPWTLGGDPGLYAQLSDTAARQPPSRASLVAWFGYDTLGRSVLARCLLGGTISLAVGMAAATISVVLGVTVGLIAGYRGGWVDSALMRTVDVLYGLPYILLVILFKIGFEPKLANGSWFPLVTVFLVVVLGGSLITWATHIATRWLGPAPIRWAARALVALLLVGLLAVLAWRGVRPLLPTLPIAPVAANLIVLFSAIGLVSWLTMARVVRGQVLSLRGQPFIEACRAMGIPPTRVFVRHILPNLVGPITVYATLTVPQAILQESFLSFLGVGVNLPLPTWGNMAAEAVQNLSPVKIYWWMLAFPCILLVVTLLSLNFMGDGLRDVFDPKREAAKI